MVRDDLHRHDIARHREGHACPVAVVTEEGVMTVKWRDDIQKWQAVINDKELFGKKRPAKSFEYEKDAKKWERGTIKEAEDGRRCELEARAIQPSG